MPLKSSLKRFWLKINKLLIFVVLICLFYAAVVFFSIFFKIKEIRFQGLKQDQIITGIEAIKDSNLLILSTKTLEKKIIDNNPFVKKVIINKIFPRTVEIVIESYRPLACLEVGRGYLVLATNGRILYQTEKELNNLPIIYYYQKLNDFSFSIGEMIGYKEINTVLLFLKKADELGLKINTVDIANLNMIGLNIGDKKILLTAEKDFGEQAYQLEMIIRQFKIQGKDFKTIDLRFNKPVIELK